MKTPKYHIYLTNEERSEVLKSLIDLKNSFIEQAESNYLIPLLLYELFWLLFLPFNTANVLLSLIWIPHVGMCGQMLFTKD